MTSEQFTYWLKGFFQLSDVTDLNQKQVQIIKDHLNLVYDIVTPNIEIQNINEVPPLLFHTPVFTDDTIRCSSNTESFNIKTIMPYTGPLGYK